MKLLVFVTEVSDRAIYRVQLHIQAADTEHATAQRILRTLKSCGDDVAPVTQRRTAKPSACPVTSQCNESCCFQDLAVVSLRLAIVRDVSSDH
jgi:hypothetical protein